MGLCVDTYLLLGFQPIFYLNFWLHVKGRILFYYSSETLINSKLHGHCVKSQFEVETEITEIINKHFYGCVEFSLKTVHSVHIVTFPLSL